MCRNVFIFSFQAATGLVDGTWITDLIITFFFVFFSIHLLSSQPFWIWGFMEQIWMLWTCLPLLFHQIQILIADVIRWIVLFLFFLALCLLCVTFVMPLVYFVACMQNTNSAMMFSKISLSGLFYLWSGLVMFMGLNKMFYKLNVSGDKKLYIHSIWVALIY